MSAELLIARIREQVPAQLLELPVWLLHDADKTPYYADGSKRRGVLDSAEDRARLVTFEEAARALERVTRACGLGVALGEVPGEEFRLCGIDLDDCYHGDEVSTAQMGALALDSRAIEILAAACSYAEKSPSGRGLHVLGVGDIGTAKVPKSATAPGLEIYSGGRYFTVTGARLNGAHLADVTDAAALARKLLTVPEKTGSESNPVLGADDDDVLAAIKLTGLYVRPGKAGMHLVRCPWEALHSPNDRGERQTSQSEAAYFAPGALMGEQTVTHGHFRCQHTHCAQRGLRDLREFLGLTAKKAAEPAITLRHIADIVAEKREAQWLKGLHKVLERNVLAVLAGTRNTFKSFIAHHWAMTAAQHGESVVILSAEGAGLDRRTDAWMRTFAPALDLRKLQMRALERAVNLTSASTLEGLQVAIADAPALIVVDTYSKYAPGLDENDNGEVALYLATLGFGLRDRYQCSVLLVAHAGHADAKRPRGASVLMSNPDAEYIVTRPDALAMTATVTRQRFKDSPSMPPLAYDAQVVDLGRMDRYGEPVTSLVMRDGDLHAALAAGKPELHGKAQRRLLDLLREERNAGIELWTVPEIREAGRKAGMHRNTARAAAEALTFTPHLVAAVGGYRLAD